MSLQQLQDRTPNFVRFRVILKCLLILILVTYIPLLLLNAQAIPHTGILNMDDFMLQ